MTKKPRPELKKDFICRESSIVFLSIAGGSCIHEKGDFYRHGEHKCINSIELKTLV